MLSNSLLLKGRLISLNSMGWDSTHDINSYDVYSTCQVSYLLLKHNRRGLHLTKYLQLPKHKISNQPKEAKVY